MAVAFGTALSGTVNINPPVLLSFESPFRFLDARSQTLSAQKPLYYESGSFLSIDASLTNRLKKMITLVSIDVALAQLEIDELQV
jgi:hypothetical protein